MRSLFLVLLLLLTAASADAQTRLDPLPFDVSRLALLSVDTSLVEWISTGTFMGGVEGQLFYRAKGVTGNECRAVALIGLVRLRNLYRRQRQQEPVALRLRLLCARTYNGNLNYDGVNTDLEIRDSDTGDVIYSGSEPGLPFSDRGPSAEGRPGAG